MSYELCLCWVYEDSELGAHTGGTMGSTLEGMDQRKFGLYSPHEKYC